MLFFNEDGKYKSPGLHYEYCLQQCMGGKLLTSLVFPLELNHACKFLQNSW